MNTCKTCGGRLVKKATRRKASQLTKPYYYTAYLYCSHCHKIYHSDVFKVVSKNVDLFMRNVLQSSEGDIEIWTDGACLYNGRTNAKAAWAFVSGHYEKSGLVEGKQTNNTAEAFAIYHALFWAAKKGYKTIRVHTDSQITIHGLAKPVEKVKENREIFQKIADVITKNNLTVHYVKVLGHSGDIDNERADKLANTLAGVS